MSTMGDNDAMKKHGGKECVKQTNEGYLNSIISLLLVQDVSKVRTRHITIVKQNAVIAGRLAISVCCG